MISGEYLTKHEVLYLGDIPDLNWRNIDESSGINPYTPSTKTSKMMGNFISSNDGLSHLNKLFPPPQKK